MTPRRVWAIRPADPYTCPAGHAIKDPLVWENGCLRCRERSHGSECGRLVYVVGGMATLQGEPLVLVAEITPVEASAMRQARMSQTDALSFLGLLRQAAA